MLWNIRQIYLVNHWESLQVNTTIFRAMKITCLILLISNLWSSWMGQSLGRLSVFSGYKRSADYVREKNYFDKTDDSKSASLLKCLTHNYTINIHSHYLYSNIFLKSCSMLFFCLGSQKEESGAQKITKHVQSVISWQNEYASCQTQLFLPLLSWQ